MDAQQAWQSVLGQLQMEMPRASFDTWVRDTEASSLEDGTLTVSTRNAYACDWLTSRLQSTVQRLLVGIMNQSVNVQFVVGETPTEELECTQEEAEQEVAIEPVQWLDYDRIVQPHKQVVVKGYLRRLGVEIGPKAIWLYIGFHQAAWKAHSSERGAALHSRDVMQFCGLSFGAFWRSLRHKGMQSDLQGLVQRVDPPRERKYYRGRDGRPHRTPVRYQVCMTPRLTRGDAGAILRMLKQYMLVGASLSDALQFLIRLDDIMTFLSEVSDAHGDTHHNTVMDIVRDLAGNEHTPELDHLAQDLHRRVINALGDIHIPHYFITQTIRRCKLTPAQAWLITVARDMSYINSRTGERRDLVTFKGGYEEMAELVGSSRYKTVQAWCSPHWEKQKRGGDITRFLIEQDSKETSYADLRVGSMSRSFRVLLDEPLDANGSNKADANGSNMVDADGSNSRTQMGVLVDASGSHMVDANGTALNSLKHPLNTSIKNTSSTKHLTRAAEAVPSFWELKTLLQQNHVHPKVQRELLEARASVDVFVSWILFASSPQGKQLCDPLGYTISQLRNDPLNEPVKSFHSFASLPPAELLLLIDSTPSERYEFKRPIQHPLAQAWKKIMGSPNPRLAAARTILFGESETD